MAVRPILLYGDPVLRKKADPIEETTEDICRLAEDMIDTMIKAEGIGLAAPQVGESIRMYVLNLEAINTDLFIYRSGTSFVGDPDNLVLINPKIVRQEGEQIGDEGCLSFPDIFDKVARPDVVRVEATELSGGALTIEGKGLLARVLIHEYDHLEGVLFIDHLSKFRLQFLRTRLKKLKARSEAD